jgi:hypothetical protein
MGQMGRWIHRVPNVDGVGVDQLWKACALFVDNESLGWQGFQPTLSKTLVYTTFQRTDTKSMGKITKPFFR